MRASTQVPAEGRASGSIRRQFRDVPNFSRPRLCPQHVIESASIERTEVGTFEMSSPHQHVASALQRTTSSSEPTDTEMQLQISQHMSQTSSTDQGVGSTPQADEGSLSQASPLNSTVELPTSMTESEDVFVKWLRKRSLGERITALAAALTVAALGIQLQYVIWTGRNDALQACLTEMQLNMTSAYCNDVVAKGVKPPPLGRRTPAIGDFNMTSSGVVDASGRNSSWSAFFEWMSSSYTIVAINAALLVSALATGLLCTMWTRVHWRLPVHAHTSMVRLYQGMTQAIRHIHSLSAQIVDCHDGDLATTCGMTKLIYDAAQDTASDDFDSDVDEGDERPLDNEDVKDISEKPPPSQDSATDNASKGEVSKAERSLTLGMWNSIHPRFIPGIDYNLSLPVPPPRHMLTTAFAKLFADREVQQRGIDPTDENWQHVHSYFSNLASIAESSGYGNVMLDAQAMLRRRLWPPLHGIHPQTFADQLSAYLDNIREETRYTAQQLSTNAKLLTDLQVTLVDSSSLRSCNLPPYLLLPRTPVTMLDTDSDKQIEQTILERAEQRDLVARGCDAFGTQLPKLAGASTFYAQNWQVFDHHRTMTAKTSIATALEMLAIGIWPLWHGLRLPQHVEQACIWADDVLVSLHGEQEAILGSHKSHDTENLMLSPLNKDLYPGIPVVNVHYCVDTPPVPKIPEERTVVLNRLLRQRRNFSHRDTNTDLDDLRGPMQGPPTRGYRQRKMHPRY